MSISNNSDDSINYIFFGHQNRFKEYIVDSFNKCIEASNGTQKLIDKTIRFCNGAILKLTITFVSLNNVELNLSLIYVGDTSSRKNAKAYWVTPPKVAESKQSTIPKVAESKQSTTPKVAESTIPEKSTTPKTPINKNFNEISITIDVEKFKEIFKCKNLEINNETTQFDLYFVRHGFSEHNKNSFLFKTNTKLIGTSYKTKLTELKETADKDADDNFIKNIIGKIGKDGEPEIISSAQTIANYNLIIFIFFMKIISYYILNGSIKVDEQSIKIYITILMFFLKKVNLLNLDGVDYESIFVLDRGDITKKIIPVYAQKVDEIKIPEEIFNKTSSEYIFIKNGIVNILYSILIEFIKKNKEVIKNELNGGEETIIKANKLLEYLNTKTSKTPLLTSKNPLLMRIDSKISLDSPETSNNNININDDDDDDDYNDFKKIAKIFNVTNRISDGNDDSNDNYDYYYDEYDVKNIIINKLISIAIKIEKSKNPEEKGIVEKTAEEILTADVAKKYFSKFLDVFLTNKLLFENGIFQSEKAGEFFSDHFKEKVLDKVFVSDLIRTQQTAEYFLSQLNNTQFPQNTPIVVLPCLHELREDETDGQLTWYKGLSQATRIIPLGTTHGVMNRENNTNCRATSKEKSSSMNPYVRKDCSMIMVNEKSIPIDWSLYHNFYKGYNKIGYYNETGYRDQNNLYRKACKDHHFIGIVLKEYYKEQKTKESDDDVNRTRYSSISDISDSKSDRSSINSTDSSLPESVQHGVVDRSRDVENPNNLAGFFSSFLPFGSKKGGRTKRKRVSVNKKRTKKNYRSKSKKVRKIRRVNKSKKGKKKATRRK